MGNIISSLRQEKGLTQRQLADMLGVTDKAVSKWERDIAFPDTANIPRLAEILGVSLEDLMNAKAKPAAGHRGANYALKLALKAVPLAMGIAVIVTSLLGEMEVRDGITMLAVGLVCLALGGFEPDGIK